MNTDPRDIISKEPMTKMQIFVIVLTVFLNALDGFDVTSISFASPGIATEWGLDRAALGIVLSMELIGMAMGSIFLGGVADKIGRRPTVLGCLVVMALGMFMVTTSSGVIGGVIGPVLGAMGFDIDARLLDLAVWRIITGLGIGGMLASVNAVSAEFANLRRRSLSVSIMSIGYPLGAVFGGMVTAQLLQSYDWRSVFYFGSIVTVVLLPFVVVFVPETVHWLAQKQPANALERVNYTLRRMGHATVSALPTLSVQSSRNSIGDIFRPGLLLITLLVTAAYFFHITTFYFILKWVPKIVVDFGFQPASAAGVLVWTNVGGATGGAVLGLLTLKFGVRGLTIAAMLLSTAAVTIFGQTAHDLFQLSLICGIAGFGTNAAIVGMYSIFAQAFPTHVRAFGTGFAVGVGRGGSVLAPIVAGFLFTAGYQLGGVAFLMALGSLIAAGVLLFLKLTPERPAPVVAERAGGRTELKGATI